VIQPVLLPVLRPFVGICGYGADNAGSVREIETAKLAVLLHRLIPLFFEDRGALVMNLMHRSKPFGGGLDLRGAAYPHMVRHIHIYTDNRRIALGVSWCRYMSKYRRISTVAE
jgi:hypothetical protein